MCHDWFRFGRRCHDRGELEWSGRLGGRHRQFRGCTQAAGQVFKSLRTFFSVCLDRSQHLAGRIDGLQNQRDQGRVEFPLAVAQLAQQGLGLVSDLFQCGERQEATGPLDRVNRAEDTPQQARIPRVLFKFDEILIQAREVFVAFDQKLANRLHIFHAGVIHDPSLIPRCRKSLYRGLRKQGGSVCPSLLYRQVFRTNSKLASRRRLFFTALANWQKIYPDSSRMAMPIEEPE